MTNDFGQPLTLRALPPFVVLSPLRLALLGLLLFMVPLVALGPRTFILLHDNLEAEVVYAYLLAKLHLTLAGGPGVVVPPIMNGLPRDALRSGLSVTLLVFNLFRDSPLLAYLGHEALVRVVALLGMYGLLRRYGLSGPAQRGLAAAVALLWAMLPAYSIFGLSVLGQPLLLRAALDLRRGLARRRAWLVCAAFPAWSALVLVAPFLAAAWGGGAAAGPGPPRPGGRPGHLAGGRGPGVAAGQLRCGGVALGRQLIDNQGVRGAPSGV